MNNKPITDTPINPTHTIPSDIAERYPHGVRTTDFANLLGSDYAKPNALYLIRKGIVEATRSSHHGWWEISLDSRRLLDTQI
jgi:hypothetical protein